MRERSPKVWELRATLGKGTDGKHRQVSRTFHGTNREAQKALRALVVDAEGGKLTHVHEKGTVADVFERWFALAGPELSPTTQRTYRGYLDNHILPALGKTPLAKLTTEQLDAFYGSLRAKGMSVSATRQNHAIVHQALRRAKRNWKLIAVNVADDVTLPRKRKKEYDHLPTVDEALAMIRAVEDTDPEYAAWLFVLAGTGRRRGELCGLRWSRVDLTGPEAIATISRAVIEVPGGVLEKDTKGHAVNDMTLDPITSEALRRHRRFCEQRAELGGVVLRPDAYVFSRRLDGAEPWRPDYTTRRFRAVREKLGLRYFRQHDLRHMVATVLMSQMDPVNVAKRLGWSDPSMLFRVYGHPSVEQDRKAAQIMGALLSPVGDGQISIDAKKPPPQPVAEPEEGAADPAE